jgi:hypothetical protein
MDAKWWQYIAIICFNTWKQWFVKQFIVLFPLKTTENILISLMKIQKYFNRESVFLNE